MIMHRCFAFEKVHTAFSARVVDGAIVDSYKEKSTSDQLIARELFLSKECVTRMTGTPACPAAEKVLIQSERN